MAQSTEADAPAQRLKPEPAPTTFTAHGVALGRATLAYRAKVPERFGGLAASQGLMFTCAGCTRGVSYASAELIKRWGEEGRIADLVARFRCTNCKLRRRPKQDVRIEVVRVYVSKSEEKRALMRDPVDRLAYDIEQVKPKRKIT